VRFLEIAGFMQRDTTGLLGPLAMWLAHNAELPLEALHDGFCRRLVEAGIPIWRAALGTETLHPEETGGQLVWLAEADATAELFYHGVEATLSYLKSPLRIVDETGEPFRQRLDGSIMDMPLLLELREQGATDYLMVPFPFLDRTRSASQSFATKAPSGFSDADIARLAIAAKLISPYAERRVLRRIAVSLLDTYVGRHAGERIYNGQVHRGAVDEIDAAILMCDMRGFTAMSNRRSFADVVATLDSWFECIAAAVEAHGGEILKFMGDGLLAMFPAESNPTDACRRAHVAAVAAGARITELNRSRAAAGDKAVDYVMALHVGKVAYGNVGGRTRLDFTVLGAAVNYASRMQELAKRLDRRVLVSNAFAEAIGAGLVDVGAHALRGFGRAERILAIDV
jgi:adenylate cyclase